MHLQMHYDKASAFVIANALLLCISLFVMQMHSQKQILIAYANALELRICNGNTPSKSKCLCVIVM